MQGGTEHRRSQNNSLIPGRPGQPPGRPAGTPPGGQIRRTVEEEVGRKGGNVERLSIPLLLLVKVLEMS